MTKIVTMLSTILGVLLLPAVAFAADGAAASGATDAMAAALAIGLAGGMCGLAQGKTASAALEGLARNPGAYDKVFVPFILGMALIESLALFGLLIAMKAIGFI
ncbi:MAG: ATP synthase F0 subunit C [Deltaproteobacteria bacterium]|nr:ATP synthase F0 subunit C [Deltaproteobacteria bacterium]